MQQGTHHHERMGLLSYVEQQSKPVHLGRPPSESPYHGYTCSSTQFGWKADRTQEDGDADAMDVDETQEPAFKRQCLEESSA
eukprot:765037-Amphidinium_carterae.1